MYRFATVSHRDSCFLTPELAVEITHERVIESKLHNVAQVLKGDADHASLRRPLKRAKTIRPRPSDWGGDRDMGFPSGRYLPSASLPLRAALRGRGLVLLRADLFAKNILS